MEQFDDNRGLNFVVLIDKFIRIHCERDWEFRGSLLGRALEAIPSFTDESSHIVVYMISVQLLSVWLGSCDGQIRTFVDDAVVVIRRSASAMQQKWRVCAQW
jgi:hypothetical protein